MENGQYTLWYLCINFLDIGHVHWPLEVLFYNFTRNKRNANGLQVKKMRDLKFCYDFELEAKRQSTT